MPTITVRLHGGLEGHQGARAQHVIDAAPGATLLDVQDLVGIPRGEVGLFVIDGELRSEGEVPRAGALVDLYPVFGGG